MAAVGTVVVGGVLVVWFVASTIHQFSPPWWGRYRRFDRMRLLPRWNFFAPRPGRLDQHLVYRDTVDGVPGPWCEIDTGRSPVVTRWLVNPARFRQKAMIDLVNRLFTARRELIERVGDEQGLQLSSGYLAIRRPTRPRTGDRIIHNRHQRYLRVVRDDFRSTRSYRVLVSKNFGALVGNSPYA